MTATSIDLPVAAPSKTAHIVNSVTDSSSTAMGCKRPAIYIFFSRPRSAMMVPAFIIPARGKQHGADDHRTQKAALV